MTHPGCVLCGLVRSCGSNPSSPVLSPQGSTTPLPSSSWAPSLAAGFADSGAHLPYHHPFERTQSPAPDGRRTGNRVGGREIMYHDKDITVYKAEGNERLCQDGRHIIIVVNEHLQSVYEFGASDIPLLSHILDIATQLLNSAAAATGDDVERGKGKEKLQVGFVGSIIRDPQSPHAHLHAHAYLPPIDTKLSGASLWRRNVIFGSLNWWSIEDLRAEIREATSNNRVKTGYEYRQAPIDKLPDAGAAIASANALNPNYSDTPLSQSNQHALQQQQQPGPSSYRSQPGPSSVSTDRRSPQPTYPLSQINSRGSVVPVSYVTSQTSDPGKILRESKGKGKEKDINDREDAQLGSEGAERSSDGVI
ncbi:hypothetical protein L804_01070 [Cryptococcus deuterogattii 2001/935-1]|nr:hypothetical protein L804_01070 [Cryptococcus deuterogattii 2001/935-1]